MMTAEWLQETKRKTRAMREEETVEDRKKYVLNTQYRYKGAEYTLKELADHPDCQVTLHGLRSRLRAEWTVYHAMITPSTKVKNILTPELRAAIIADYEKLTDGAMKEKYHMGMSTIKKILMEDA